MIDAGGQLRVRPWAYRVPLPVLASCLAAAMLRLKSLKPLWLIILVVDVDRLKTLLA